MWSDGPTIQAVAATGEWSLGPEFARPISIHCRSRSSRWSRRLLFPIMLSRGQSWPQSSAWRTLVRRQAPAQPSETGWTHPGEPSSSTVSRLKLAAVGPAPGPLEGKLEATVPGGFCGALQSLGRQVSRGLGLLGGELRRPGCRLAAAKSRVKARTFISLPREGLE